MFSLDIPLLSRPCFFHKGRLGLRYVAELVKPARLGWYRESGILSFLWSNNSVFTDPSQNLAASTLSPTTVADQTNFMERMTRSIEDFISLTEDAKREFDCAAKKFRQAWALYQRARDGQAEIRELATSYLRDTLPLFEDLESEEQVVADFSPPAAQQFRELGGHSGDGTKVTTKQTGTNQNEQGKDATVNAITNKTKRVPSEFGDKFETAELVDTEAFMRSNESRVHWKAPIVEGQEIPDHGKSFL